MTIELTILERYPLLFASQIQSGVEKKINIIVTTKDNLSDKAIDSSKPITFHCIMQATEINGSNGNYTVKITSTAIQGKNKLTNVADSAEPVTGSSSNIGQAVQTQTYFTKDDLQNMVLAFHTGQM